MTALIEKIEQIRGLVNQWKKAGLSVGLVPTMGALHKGHAALINCSVVENDRTVVTIFVNPLQFGEGEDLAKYPRTLEKDTAICRQTGVDVVFAPSGDEMYPQQPLVHIMPEPQLAAKLCGESRPGHFTGVATVVAKLFSIIPANTAYFGAKDYQQTLIIKRMVADLNFDIAIRTIPTIREENGLAISSRNSYLSEVERAQAACLYQALLKTGELIKNGICDTSKIITSMRKFILKNPSAVIDYIEVVDAHTLERMDRVEGEVLIALAVFIGSTRLIDNIVLRIN